MWNPQWNHPSPNFVIQFTPANTGNSDYLDEYGSIIDEEYWDDIDEMRYPL
jgi:hypothetical protein